MFTLQSARRHVSVVGAHVVAAPLRANSPALLKKSLEAGMLSIKAKSAGYAATVRLEAARTVVLHCVESITLRSPQQEDIVVAPCLNEQAMSSTAHC